MSAIDVHSETWKSVMAFARVETEAATVELAAFGTSIERTQYVRGKIAALSALQGLPLAPVVAQQPIR